MLTRRLGRANTRCVAPSLSHANQHGPTHTLPKNLLQRNPKTTGPRQCRERCQSLAGERAGGHGHMTFGTIPAPQIALTITMPDAGVKSTARARCCAAAIRSARHVIFMRQCAPGRLNRAAAAAARGFPPLFFHRASSARTRRGKRTRRRETARSISGSCRTPRRSAAGRRNGNAASARDRPAPPRK
jgi:hypothetical protein